MNLDEIFQLQETDLLVSTSPLLLFACIACAVLAAWFCVHKYRDTYDDRKSVRLYLPFAAAGILVFMLCGLPFLFCVGAQLAGLISMAFIASRYFRK